MKNTDTEDNPKRRKKNRKGCTETHRDDEDVFRWKMRVLTVCECFRKQT